MLKQCFILCAIHLFVFATTQTSFSQESAGLVQSISSSHIYTMAMSHDGSQIAFGSNGIQVRDVVSKDVIAEIPELAYSIRFSPDGKSLLVNDYELIKVYDIQTQEINFSVSMQEYGFISALSSKTKFTADGQYIFHTGYVTQAFGLIGMNASHPSTILNIYPERLQGVEITSDLRDLVYVQRLRNHAVKRFHIETEETIVEWENERNYFFQQFSLYPRYVEIIPDENLLILLGSQNEVSLEENEVLIFDYINEVEVNCYSTIDFTKYFMSPDKQNMIVTDMKNDIVVVDTKTGDVIQEHQFDRHNLYEPMCFSGDGKKIAFCVEPEATPSSANSVTPSTSETSATIYIYDITTTSGVQNWMNHP